MNFTTLTEPQKKWLAALRSGEFEQGKRRLRTHDGSHYCCLGVACQISELGSYTDCAYIVNKDPRPYELPKEVQTWLGLKTPNGAFGVDQSLAKMNDDGISFSHIADYIEYYPSMFFTQDQSSE
jgi:hypothetical protein